MNNPSELWSDVEVLVVGAGPVGLTLAASLGRHGVRCALIERSVTPGVLPKMDLSNPRTMEVFGRLGLAEKIRTAGWPLDARFDVLAGPSLIAPPYAVLGYPSIEQMQAQIAAVNDGSQPREPYERISQYTLEKLLREELQSQPTVQFLFGQELVGFGEDGDGVVAKVKAADGGVQELRCRYLAGCDGGNSRVRSLLGIPLTGQAAVARNYMIFFRAPELLARTGLRPFRHYCIAGARHATLVAQDDLQRWALHVVIGPDTDAAALDARAEIRASLGVDLEVEILHTGAWTPHLLVAERFSQGRVFLVGDAGHQYIPTGGFGMNTGITEADNLAWKLAAVVQGWGGSKLLDSYHDERQPVALRNCRASAFAAEGVRAWRGHFDPVVIEPATVEARARRVALGEAVDLYQRRSHEQRGIEMGYRYTQSAVCALEAGETSDPDSPVYLPNATPGARLPHAWIEPGVSVHDRLGPQMSLLALDADAVAVDHFTLQAQVLGIPLTVLALRDQPALRRLYGARLLLLRPDLHVAWRGDDTVQADRAAALLRMAVGH